MTSLPARIAQHIRHTRAHLLAVVQMMGNTSVAT
jgi:hypothetical protein